MPKNYQALIRHNTIDRCLHQAGRHWNWKSLAEACARALLDEGYPEGTEPKERTIKKDIADMRSGALGYQAPILFNRKRKTYYYADPLFSPFGHNPISQHELDPLRQALLMLRSLNIPHAAQELEKVLARLETKLGSESQQPGYQQVIQFDRVAQGAQGLQWFPALYQACQQKQSILLRYHPFTVEVPYLRAVSPYLLKEYNKRWFLIGYDHQEERVHTFALDRIQHVESPSLREFYLLPSFDPQSWYRHIIGVSMPYDAQPVAIRLLASPMRAHYLRTKPLHASQQEEDTTPQGVVFSFFLIPNIEWERLLLSFAEEIQVLAPASLRESLAQRILQAAQRYHSTPP